MTSIKQKTLHSLKWSTIEKIGQFSIQLIISIVLARILEPEQYALVGILMIFINISSVLVDAGFSQGLIRKLDCNDNDYNSVFWFNLLMSIIIYFVLFLCMPLIAHFFNLPKLITTGRVLMLVIPINALNVVQTTIINKELQFKKIAKYTLFVTPISGIIGIILAYSGFEVWALIWQTLIYSVLTVIVFWAKSKWKPTFKIDFKPVHKLMGFSLKLSASSLINAIFNNISPTVIAKLFDKNQLGYFTQAQKYATMPSTIIESILNRMTYPILSKLQYDKEQYINAYRKIQITMFAFLVPIMLLLILCGKEGIIIILGHKWIPSIPIFQILCLSAITLPFHPLTISNLKVYGRSGLILNLEIIKKIMIIISILGGLPWGIKGLVWGQTIYFWIALILNMYYGGKQIGYSLRNQIKDILPGLILSIFAMTSGYITNLFSLSLFTSLIMKIFIFVIIFLLGIFTINVKQFQIAKNSLKL